jgi:hypothetical protein
MKQELLSILFFSISILFPKAEISAQFIDFIDDESWNDTIWVKSGKNIFTYDESGYLISEIYKMYRNKDYTNQSQIKYSYNKSGNPEIKTYLNWNSTEWKPNTKSLFTYDSNGSMTCETTIVSFNEGATWDSYTREIYTNDSIGKPVQSLFQRWISNEYHDKEKTSYTFNSSGKISSTILSFMDGTDWKDFTRTTYTYNDSGQLTNKKTEFWSESDGTWSNNSQCIYSYGLNGKTSIEVCQSWISGAWVNNSRSVYNYQNAVGIRDEEPAVSIFEIYPNPASDIINLALENESEIKEITISDLRGLVIKRINMYDSNTPIDISSIPSGPYYLTMITGTGSQTRKLVKR